MSRQFVELQTVLAQLIDEHRKLLKEIDLHEKAIKKVDVKAMEISRLRQEAMRTAISVTDAKRKRCTDLAAAELRITSPTVTRLAEVAGQFKPKLLAQRDELRDVISQITHRNHIAGRVASALLGHMNTVVRLMAGAMQQAGVYTKQGLPVVVPRLGALEAIG